jgi:hypothetical protein
MTNDFVEFSYAAVDFHRAIPPAEHGILAGYTALIKKYDLKCPIPDSLSVIGTKHRKYTDGICHFFTPRHAPDNSLLATWYSHLKMRALN